MAHGKDDDTSDGAPPAPSGRPTPVPSAAASQEDPLAKADAKQSASYIFDLLKGLLPVTDRHPKELTELRYYLEMAAVTADRIANPSEKELPQRAPGSTRSRRKKGR